MIIDHIFRNQAFTPPTTIYCSLHTADPAETGANECTGGSYARQSVTFSAASGGASSNSGALNFTGMPACTVTHVALWSLVSGGNCLMEGALTSSKAVGAGDTFQIAIGDLDLSMA